MSIGQLRNLLDHRHRKFTRPSSRTNAALPRGVTGKITERCWLKRHVSLARKLSRGAGLLLLLALGALSCSRATAAETPVSKEYQLKAAFLYNFTKFVAWPPPRFADETSPIVVAVVGRNPFGEELENVIKGRFVNGRAIAMKVVMTPEEASTAHLLFVPAGEETRLPAAVLQRDGLVAVGESDAFAALGGAITFVQVGGKMRFEINLAAAERGHVKISAQLLKLATVVRARSEGKP